MVGLVAADCAGVKPVGAEVVAAVVGAVGRLKLPLCTGDTLLRLRLAGGEKFDPPPTEAPPVSFRKRGSMSRRKREGEQVAV